jgi:hypothetical protein
MEPKKFEMESNIISNIYNNIFIILKLADRRSLLKIIFNFYDVQIDILLKNINIILKLLSNLQVIG